ncbi:MAG: hypothetical protein FWG82_06575, partial [Oscillospiraceae bacterium]|nr:hypothetical protein [Oscillospiraceae bacterium]
MSMILSAPRKFIIGNGEISKLAKHASLYGSPILMVAHKDDAGRVKSSLDRVKEDGIDIVPIDFSGEATRAEADRASAL